MWSQSVLLAVRRSQSRSDYEIELRQHGFDVTTADDGLASLQALRQFTPDLVIIEPELLWGGGDGVVAALRDNPTTRGVPVLVLTTDSSRSAVYRISQFPIADFLMQPVSADRLIGRVARLALSDQQSSPAEPQRLESNHSIDRKPAKRSGHRRERSLAGVS